MSARIDLRLVNPLFTNEAARDYTISVVSSPLVDAGFDASSITPESAEDFIGAARPAGSGWDIGAFEFGGVIAPQPPGGNSNKKGVIAGLVIPVLN